MDQEQHRKLGELQKQNDLLESDVRKLHGLEEELAAERHNLHLLKVDNVKNSQRVAQL